MSFARVINSSHYYASLSWSIAFVYIIRTSRSCNDMGCLDKGPEWIRLSYQKYCTCWSWNTIMHHTDKLELLFQPNCNSVGMAFSRVINTCLLWQAESLISTAMRQILDLDVLSWPLTLTSTFISKQGNWQQTEVLTQFLAFYLDLWPTIPH